MTHGSKKKELTMEIRKYLELNDNENISYQKLWDAAIAIPRSRFVAFKGYITKNEEWKLSWIFYLNNIKDSRMKETIQSRN